MAGHHLPRREAVGDRCLLVPALVALFGRYNWWLPRWMATTLRVQSSPLPAPAANYPCRHRRAQPVGATNRLNPTDHKPDRDTPARRR